jgi:hypothetical protein
MQRLSLVGDKKIVSLVCALLKLGRPCAVRRLVVSVDVFSVDGSVDVPVFREMSREGIEHVVPEVLEGLPAVADLDASATVVGITLAVRVRAPFPHGLPTSVKRRLSHSMPEVAFQASLSLKASAR